MKNPTKQMLALLLGAAVLGSACPVLAAGAQTSAAGTPYAADGSYDVTVEHVLVNQVFGASDDAEVVSHSFVELYNPTDAAVSLDGWFLYYRSSADGKDNDAWKELALEGSIASEGYFLIRCGQVDSISAGAYMIPEGDMEWDVRLHNKGVSVALFSEKAAPGEAFAGAITEANRPAGYVDLLAAQGNDTEETQIPPAYEGGYADIQSKKKAIARKDFADTDNNASDAEDVGYDDVTPADKPVQNSKGETISAQTYDVKNDGFAADSLLTMEKKGGVTLGEANPDGGVAEIVAYNEDNDKAYVVNGADSLLNVFDVRSDGTFGDVTSVNVAQLMQAADASFTYGDMTSVAVDPVHDRIAVALQDADFTKAGRIALLSYDNEIVEVYTAGVQPDMVTFAGEGRYVLTADEGEPREGYGAGMTDPEGSVTVADTQTDSVKIARFTAFDAAQLGEEGVVFNDPDGDGTPVAAALDLEPEYIAVDGNTAYVALQEANAIAVLDIAAGEFTAVESLGFKDLSLEENAIDLDDSDADYAPATYENTYGVYMPDGIAAYHVGDKTYLFTANEGDAREWGDFSDEAKRTLTSADGSVTAEKVHVLDNGVKVGLGEGNYLYGARSFSVFEVTDSGMQLVFDSGNDFEAMTWEYLPKYYNVSNDDVELESRTAKKGTEPEAVTLAAVGAGTYAFIALERIGGIMVYDVTDPAKAEFVNYVNTRDFSTATAGDVAPEGLAVIEQGNTALLLAAFEVSGTVASYEITATGAAALPEEPEDPGENPGEQPEDPGENPGEQPENPDGTSEETPDEGGMTPGAVAGIVIACVVAAAAVVAIVIVIVRRKKN